MAASNIGELGLPCMFDPPWAVWRAQSLPTSAGLITWPVLRSVWQLGTKSVPGADENPKSLRRPRRLANSPQSEYAVGSLDECRGLATRSDLIPGAGKLGAGN